MSIEFFSKKHHHSFPSLFSRDKFKITEHASLYLTNTLRVMAISLVGVFLPIYIFEISQNFLFFNANPVINGMSWVLAYFLLRSVFTIFTILTLGRFIFTKMHFQLSMVISMVLLIFEIILWLLSQGNLFLILIAGIVAGFKVTFYWLPYHIFFIRKSEEVGSDIGAKTGLRFFLARVFAGITPAIGGYIISQYGFGALFITSILILVCASLPIMFVIHEWKHRDHDVVKVIRDYTLNHKFVLTTFSYIGEGIEAVVYAIFWPIMLFLFLSDFLKIGFLNTFSFLVSSIVFLLIGKLIDKYGSRAIHLTGIFFNSLFYSFRILLINPIGFYVVDILDRINSGLYVLPQMSATYKKARDSDPSDYSIHREISLHVGIVLISSIIIGFINIFGVWRWVFVFAIFGAMMTYLIDIDDDYS